ncbi:hypothetical protein EFL95_11875 [Nocardioides marmorisolisilvae]|uniref:DUF1097 domain-containing protein n=1 Tax=Nocardioides marmorisolisilvae TaxID=1542737 RepID=A0A3N0DVK8_9ACTN|nr:hypothetical protein EFL95_11875 [Nocardioides marmorisolisilvae]
MYAGAVLALAAMGAVMAGSALGLELESVALLGAAMGAVVALVPDRTPTTQLAGFAAGFVIGWSGYIFRAQFMPDTTAGRAVAVGFVVMACVAVAFLTNDRITLWTVILGAGAFAGAYEFAYNQAPPEILSTSVSTATTMAFNVALGFLAGVVAGPVVAGAQGMRRGRPTPDAPEGDHVDAPVEAPVATSAAATDEREFTTLSEFMKETVR